MILKPNKYLKELGIDEHYWLFDKSNQDDPRYVPNEEGFVDAEHFSLDTSLSLYIYSQLCYFKDHCLYGTPMGMSIEKWINILDAMIEAFRLLIIEEQIEPWQGRVLAVVLHLRLEGPTGFEPAIRELQSHALPLG